MTALYAGLFQDTSTAPKHQQMEPHSYGLASTQVGAYGMLPFAYLSFFRKCIL